MFSFRPRTNESTATSFGAVPRNQWAHIAVARKSGILYVFVNGSLRGTMSAPYNVTEGPLTFGRVSNKPEFVREYFHGMIDELRLVPGTALWTTNFTPPTAPYPDTGATDTSIRTDFVLDGSTILRQTTGSTAMDFYYDASGSLLGLDYNNTRYYYIKNLQGDVIALIDTTGQTVVEYTYDTWGNILSIAGSLASTLGQDNPFRYRSYYYDNETGFYYLQSRYYDPSTHRFINADGQMNPGMSGKNMFAYCENNPITYIDNDGRKVVFPDDATTGGTVTVYLGVHPVLAPLCHTSLIIFAYPNSELYNDDRFTNYDENRKAKYVTLGAGGDKLGGLAGNLTAEYDRSKDVKLDIKLQMIKLNVSASKVNSLFELMGKYENNVKYDLFAFNSYNSNSFAHGLLNAAEINLPVRIEMGLDVPGWDKPLPKKYFGD